MPRYRLDGLEVDAFQITEVTLTDPHGTWPDWLLMAYALDAGECGAIIHAQGEADVFLILFTPRGSYPVGLGDWLVRGIDPNMLCPVAPWVFEAQFERMTMIETQRDYGDETDAA